MKDHPWTEAEAHLYSLLLDIPEDCPWAIRDILLDEQIPEKPVVEVDLTGLTSLVRTALAYCNSELCLNEDLISPTLIRPGKYPRIRQMRDVHQFDVGTHLVLTATLILRRGPEFYLKTRGYHDICHLLERGASVVGWPMLVHCAIFHDFFKCFRRRRQLPSKTGKSRALRLRLPDGKPVVAATTGSEEDIARTVLPTLAGNLSTPDMTAILDVSAQYSTIYYRCLGISAPDVHAFALKQLEEVPAGPLSIAGLYLSLADWLAKGYARFVITKRKNRVRSLENAVFVTLEQFRKHVTRFDSSASTD